MAPFIISALVVIACAVLGVRDLRHRRYARAAVWIGVGLFVFVAPLFTLHVEVQLPPANK